MPRKPPFIHHRFPREIIRRAVLRYMRYSLSDYDVADLLALNFGQEIACPSLTPTKTVFCRKNEL